MMLYLGDYQKELTPKLLDIIEKYNQLATGDDLEKIYLLQKIHKLVTETSLDEVDNEWVYLSKPRTLHKGSTYEEELQKYGIHLHASLFLISYEFALRTSKLAEIPQKSRLDFYALTRIRNHLLERNPDKLDKKLLQEYLACSTHIAKYYEKDTYSKKKLERAITNLSLSYDLIAFKHGALSSRPKPTEQRLRDSFISKNDIKKITLEGSCDAVVMKVGQADEGRLEYDLHAYPISESFLVEFSRSQVVITEQTRPLILTKHAEDGSLDEYAISLHDSGKSIAECLEQTRSIFLQISKFCESLIHSGFYFPDIKLTNFLRDEEVVFVADRKSFVKKGDECIFINDTHARLGYLEVSQAYLPREFLVHFLPENEFCITAADFPVNLEKLMSYLLGVSLIEFLYLSLTDTRYVSTQTLHNLDPAILLKIMPNNQILNNLVLLSKAMTLPDKTRLSISEIATLMQNTGDDVLAFEQYFQKVAKSTFKEAKDKVFADTASATDSKVSTPLQALSLLSANNSPRTSTRSRRSCTAQAAKIMGRETPPSPLGYNRA